MRHFIVYVYICVCACFNLGKCEKLRLYLYYARRRQIKETKKNQVCDSHDFLLSCIQGPGALWSNVFPGAGARIGALNFLMLQGSFCFLLFEHILCRESIVIVKKIRLWDFDAFIRFEVSRFYLCYFRDDVYMYVCVHVIENDSI